MKNIDQIINFARSTIIIDLPFFGSLLVGLRTVENKMIPTFRMDGEKIEYNPDFVETLKPKEIRTILCECILHGALGHVFRLEARDPERWNRACDYAVANVMRDSNLHALQQNNAQLRDYFELGGVFKDWCPANKEFDNLAAEDIYNKLPRKPPGKANPQGAGQNDPDGESEGQKNEPGEPGDEPPEPTSTGEVVQAKGDRSELEEKQSQWEVKVIQAANAAKQIGTLPSLLQRLVDDISSPRVPWRDQLRQFFNVRQRDDFSWRRPKNSLLHQGIYLPSLDSVRMGAIVVAVDTSGSVSDEILKAFQSEVQAVMDECCPARLVVIYCDAEVNLVKEYQAGDIIELKAVGGGGTDFRPVFRFVDTADIEPCCLVYLTDLMGSFPKEQPIYPVLWGCILKDEEAPFGETIYIDAES